MPGTSDPVDRADLPPPWKTYRTAQTFPLPFPIGMGLQLDRVTAPGELTRAVLGDLAGYLLGLTRVHWLPDAELHMLSRTGLRPKSACDTVVCDTVVAERPVPSGGRCYPSELYLATRALPDLPAGLYHYAPARHALERLRAADTRADLVRCLAAQPHRLPGVVALFTSVFWRTAATYGEFAYRLQALEAGALAGQLLALGGAAGLPAEIHVDFGDEPVDRLLRLDTERESCHLVVTLSTRDEAAVPTVAPCGRTDPGPPPATVLPGPARAVLPLSAAVHAAAVREIPVRPDTPFAWHRPAAVPGTAGTTPADRPVRLADRPVRLADRPVRPAAGIPYRCSATQGFRTDSIPADEFGAMLTAAGAGYASDLPGTADRVTHTLPYVAVNRVRGLAPGGYRYEPASGRLGQVFAGDPLRLLAASLPVSCQAVFEASAAFFLVGDVERGVPLYGDRWYRMQHIECGLLAERICLVAAALGLGSHLRCDYDAAGVGRVFGLAAPAQTPLAMVLVGPPRQPRPLHVPLSLGSARPAAEPMGEARR
jgi:SagB-type dehydrogenase family enzyme